MRHFWRFPDDLQWRRCIHRSTEQLYSILEQDSSVETVHGTMTARKGDYLMEGANHVLYVLTPESYRLAYKDLL